MHRVCLTELLASYTDWYEGFYFTVRYIACSLVLMANPSEPSESSLHKQITVCPLFS